MAGPLDIVLKIGADIRDAVTGLNRVEEGAKRAERQVTTLRDRFKRGAGRAGDIFGDLLSGASPESIAQNLLPTAGLALIAEKMAEFSAKVYNDRLNAELKKANDRLAQAASTPEAAAAFAAGVTAGVNQPGGTAGKTRQAFRAIGDVLTGKAGVGALTNIQADPAEVGRRARADFKRLAESDWYLAAAVLAQLPPELSAFRDDFAAILKETQQRSSAEARAAQYRAGLRQQGSSGGGLTVNNSYTTVYSAFDGLGGRSAVGREVRSVLDARDRNNGRYVNTASRRS